MTPTLDSIAHEPALAVPLPPEARAALLAQALAVVGALAAAPILTLAGAGSTEDRVLDVAETARRLDVSQDFVYRNHGRWPFTIRRGRKLGFSEQGLADHLRRRPQQSA